MAFRRVPWQVAQAVSQEDYARNQLLSAQQDAGIAAGQAFWGVANGVEQVKALASHPDFTLSNPNRARALYMSAAMNSGVFHVASGAGYDLIADLILALDPLNAQTAARFVPALKPAPVDLMYGYLEGRRYARGMLGFKLGRQYVVDPLVA